MAVGKQEYTTWSPQEHSTTCDKHSYRIGIFCDDCDEFICSKCAKTDHKIHNWDTLATVASQRRREFMEGNTSFMSDYVLIDNHRELKRLMADLDVKVRNCEYSARYLRGEISDDVIESIIGHTLDLNDIIATETNSFRHGNHTIFILEAVSEDYCYIRSTMSKIKKVNTEGKEKYESGINAKDVCVKVDGCVYYTDYRNKCISSLSTYGYLSTIVSTKPLTPGGICFSLDRGLLVTLTDELSDAFKLRSHGRRLVRHLKMNGDLIHDHEYQEDGRTKIFMFPTRVTQNGNKDICVVNQSGERTGKLVILSSSGRVRSIADRT
ncbi:uncharacterized protein LOC133186514 [Saccostrea echinata]|uniref:uncharacterized protein LOC133186514 n=1 Tax=Saccostrea echinata TaxID=191078 RepID=UPI002A83A44F|nr:uncharacterized protein LOC133186514 [Saccostrea echinata]